MTHQQQHLWNDDIFTDEKITAHELTRLCNKKIAEESLQHFHSNKKSDHSIEATGILQDESFFRARVKSLLQGSRSTSGGINAVLLININSGTRKTDDFNHLVMHEAIAIILQNIRKNDVVTRINNHKIAVILEFIPKSHLNNKIETIHDAVNERIRSKWCKLYRINFDCICLDGAMAYSSIMTQIYSNENIQKMPADTSLCTNCNMR